MDFTQDAHYVHITADGAHREGFHCIFRSVYVLRICSTGYMLVYHVPHAEHMESLIRRNGEARSKQRRAAFRLLRSRVSERTKFHKSSPVTIPLLSSVFYINYSVHVQSEDCAL